MIFLGVGSSIGNAVETFSIAEKFLNAIGIEIVQKSNILKNPPFGKVAKNEFSNAVWEITVPRDITPIKLLDILKAAETAAGRNLSDQRWADRILDLDILMFNEQIINTEELTIPHIGIAERDFVLIPWGELVDENFEIPTLGALKSLLKK